MNLGIRGASVFVAVALLPGCATLDVKNNTEPIADLLDEFAISLPFVSKVQRTRLREGAQLVRSVGAVVKTAEKIGEPTQAERRRADAIARELEEMGVKGPVVWVREARLMPAKVVPPQWIEFEIDYGVQGPDRAEVDVKEQWIIFHESQQVVYDSSEAAVSRVPGVWRVAHKVYLRDVNPGNYIVHNIVRTSARQAVEVTAFVVGR